MAGSGSSEMQYSISVRVRRTITEEVHVLVPVTEEVADGDRLDPDKVFEVALRIAAEPDHPWRREGTPAFEIHPIQTPPPHAAADQA